MSLPKGASKELKGRFIRLPYLFAFTRGLPWLFSQVSSLLLCQPPGWNDLGSGLLIPVLFGPLVCRSCWSSRGMSKGDTYHHELPAKSGSNVLELQGRWFEVAQAALGAMANVTQSYGSNW